MSMSSIKVFHCIIFEGRILGLLRGQPLVLKSYFFSQYEYLTQYSAVQHLAKFVFEVKSNLMFQVGMNQITSIVHTEIPLLSANQKKNV